MNSMQLLIASVNTDSSIFDTVNAVESVIVANQDPDSKVNCQECKNNCQLITTNTKGVGKNRNIALLAADAEIVLFGDDDMEYIDGYREIVIKAFKDIPDADIIIFNLDYQNSPVNNTRRVTKTTHRVHFWNALNYGAPRIAMRLNSQRRANLWFSLQFGGGAKYNAGEDCLFIAEALRKKLKIYVHPATIARTDLSQSSWFKGYDRKFFFDKGALFKALFPYASAFMSVQFIIRHRDTLNPLTPHEALRAMLSGSKAYKASA